MGSAFWFLMVRSARNRIISQLNRLKEPRYAIALLVGVGYLWFFLFSPRATPPGTSTTPFVTVIPLIGAIGLFIAVARWWAMGGDRRALSFTPAEIQFLFPAPIERKALIQWKLLRWQILIVVNALIWMVIARRTQPPIPVPLYVVSMWVLFSTLSMHRLGSALTKAGVATHWRTGLRYQAIPIALVIGATASLYIAISGRWAGLTDLCCGRAFWPYLEETLRQPGAAVVLLPFRLLMAPVGAMTVGAWATAMVPALGLLVVHYVWVMRAQVAFEEAAVRASAETVERLARFKGDRKGVPRKAGRTLPLAPSGWPGTAIIWKNIIAITRGAFSRSFVIVLMALVAAFAAVMGSEDRAPTAVALGTTALAMAAILSFLGPVWIRNDLRSDMNYLSLLRSYPLSGRTIVVAEIIGSTLTLTVIQLILALVGYLGVSTRIDWSRYGSVELILLLAIPSALILNGIGMTIQNAAALLFPTWMRFDRVRPGGFETLGQNILSSLFTLFLSALAVAGPALTGSFLWSSLVPRLGPWAIVPVLVGVTMVGIVELRLLIRWLGRVFERTESIT